MELRGSQGMGVVSRIWFDWCVIINYLHVQTLRLTEVQTPIRGTPLVLLKLSDTSPVPIRRVTIC